MIIFSKNLSRLMLLIAGFLFSLNASASICYGIEASSDSAVTIEIIPDQDYSNSPIPESTWSTGAFTLCWSNGVGSPSIINTTAESALPFLPDGPTGATDAETCQIFSFIGPVVLDMVANVAIPVLTIEFDCSDCASELTVSVNTNPPNPPIVNGISSILNFFGEEFDSAPECPLSTSLSFGGAAQQASLNATVFFEGYYDGSGLSNALNQLGILPTEQPYNVAPFNYTGNESVSSFAPDIVDWVLLELRDANDDSNVIDRKAGLINTAGSIIDSSGSGPLVFDNALAGDYSVVVFHRGHVAVMSANPVSLPNTGLDLTTSTAAVRGIEQTVSSNGAFVMRAGDYNGSGTVNFGDFILWLSNNNILNTYLFIDGDGNGTINFVDFILWLSNNNHLAFSGI